MPCTHVRIGTGNAIVCGPRRKPKPCSCNGGRPATLLCDWKVEGGTCDKPICTDCSTSPAPNKDLCVEHAEAWRAWRDKKVAEPPPAEASAAA